MGIVMIALGSCLVVLGLIGLVSTFSTPHIALSLAMTVLLLLVPGGLLIRAGARRRRPADVARARLCTACGVVASPKRLTPGSMVIEIALWLFFLLPGLIYSIWRLVSRRDACPSCGAYELIPPDSPRAVALIAQFGRAPEPSA